MLLSYFYLISSEITSDKVIENDFRLYSIDNNNYKMPVYKSKSTHQQTHCYLTLHQDL